MLRYHDVGQGLVDHEGKIRSKKVDPMIARKLLVAAVIEHYLPFSFVEYEWFMGLSKYLNPDIPCISRNTLVSDITKLYLKEKEKLKQVLANIQNRICLTYDICPPHLGVELAAKVFGILKEWGIEKKIFSLTLDNTSNFDAHILNTIVQDGLEVVNLALQKIREFVEYVKCFESRVKKFEECVSAVGNVDTSIGFKLDMPTCWKSSYLMLDSAIKYKKAFASLELIDRNYKFCPSVEEWERCEKICEFLEPFYDITNMVTKFSYPTSNLYFIQVWKIEVMLKENLFHEDALISDMCRRMKEKFDDYWNQYSIVLALGAVFDPRIKLSLLECLFSKVESDPIKCQEEIKAYESQIITNAKKSQLDLYLEEPKLQLSGYEDLDVLEYWKNNMHRYPILALMARDVLAIPITTVISESTFSIGTHVLTKYKDCFPPKKLEAFICIRNWLHGYVIGGVAIHSHGNTMDIQYQHSPLGHKGHSCGRGATAKTFRRRELTISARCSCRKQGRRERHAIAELLMLSPSTERRKTGGGFAAGVEDHRRCPAPPSLTPEFGKVSPLSKPAADAEVWELLGSIVACCCWKEFVVAV
nr:zinc finger BED domain-containing protein RICESLEEPER 2-like [Ipomoea batatas]